VLFAAAVLTVIVPDLASGVAPLAAAAPAVLAAELVDDSDAEHTGGLDPFPACVTVPVAAAVVPAGPAAALAAAAATGVTEAASPDEAAPISARASTGPPPSPSPPVPGSGTVVAAAAAPEGLYARAAELAPPGEVRPRGSRCGALTVLVVVLAPGPEYTPVMSNEMVV
jgi:hypothetical protein